jgi:hypothetical protein
MLHLACVAVAALLIFGLRLDRVDLQPVIGRFDIRSFRDYTPYYPGMAELGTHEIFSPRYAQTRKIVFLGASNVDSIGCDYTWSLPPASKATRNAHYSCSIAGQMNELLDEAGQSGWRAFDLARNGSKLTPMLYTYARIRELKPDIVIFGEAFPYYAQDNAGAATMKWAQMSYLDEMLGGDPKVAGKWSAYKAQMGEPTRWMPPEGTPPPSFADDQPAYRDSTSLSDLLVRGFTLVRKLKWLDGPPLPISYDTATKAFSVEEVYDFSQADKLDPQLSIFAGFSIINDLQNEQGGKFLLYYAPSFRHRNDTNFIETLRTGKYGQFLDGAQVPFEVYVDLPLKPVYETYDGVHQTRAGNRIIASKILQDLKRRNILH